jgi:hypothetical protein
MTRNSLFLVIVTALAFVALAGSTWAQCPEDSHDRGICDTMYVEPWPDDIPLSGSPPYFIRVPIYVTCDVVNDLDSIRGFVIPLCYTTDSPTKYCSLSAYWNTTSLFSFVPDFARSIFRHIEGLADTARNRMADMAADFSGREWDSVILDLDGTGHFFLNMVQLGSADQGWWEGSRVLLATMTFKVEEQMRICMDSCTWPPANRLAWAVLDDESSAWTKIPRSGTGTSVYGGCFNASDVRGSQTPEENRPSGFSLSQNYPNPFNPVTNFQFSLSASAHVRIEIFNLLGQRVATIVDREMKPGVYVADWDGTNDQGNPVSSGIYFCRMQAGDFSGTKRMVLLK